MPLNYPIAKINKVDVRKVWPSEPRDFTKWLVGHIDQLSDALGIDLSEAKDEEKVGPYYVDIYAEDDKGNRVIIENQLEKSDHTHLGQIITYLVNLEAKTAVWVTPLPAKEHKQVIEWLNKTTPSDYSFYLVKVEGIRVDGNKTVGPLFTVVEGPSKEMKDIGQAIQDDARSLQIRNKFWTQLLDQMTKQTKIAQNLRPSVGSWIGIGLGKTGVGLNLSATKKYARTEIYINTNDASLNKKYFDRLYKQRKSIEKIVGHRLVWERRGEWVTSRIKDQIDDVSIFEERDWSKINKFLIDSAIKMSEAFGKYVRGLKSHDV